MKNSIFKYFIVATIFVLFSIKTYYELKKSTYMGIVEKHIYEPPMVGNRTFTEKYWILMREDRSKKVIRVEVDVPTYYNLQDGDVTSFTIRNTDMYKYGNTSDWKKNLYGE